MIGVIIVGHGNLASEIISVVESILGKQNLLESVSVKVGEGEETLRQNLERISNIKEIDGILILSDIFGGSFSNSCVYFAKNTKHVGVVTGVNLPMVLKVLTYRNSVSLADLVSLACKGGKDGILDACGLSDKGK